jgi:hypothetical protein
MVHPGPTLNRDLEATMSLATEVLTDLDLPGLLRFQAEQLEYHAREARSGSEYAEGARRIIEANAPPEAIRALAERIEAGDVYVTDPVEVGFRLFLTDAVDRPIGALTLNKNLSPEEAEEALRWGDPVEDVESVVVAE